MFPLARAGYVTDEHGLTELLGDARSYARCAGGWPLEVCEETALAPGLWSKVFTGDQSYLEPPPLGGPLASQGRFASLQLRTSCPYICRT